LNAPGLMIGMSDADQLRERATRLLALALKARDDGHPQYADELTQLASEAFDQVTDMERRLVLDPKTPSQQPAQQQQQPQPGDPGKKQND
jgi:hypothetical protein